MDNQISNRKCQQHDENVIATSLNLQCDEQNRYFCSKCLVLKINDRAIHTNTDAQERIITMKSELNQKLKIQRSKILNFKNLLATTLDEINSTIENEIKRLQNVQKQIEENIKFIDIYNFDKIEEAQKLLEQQFSSFRTAINSQITKMESNLKMDSYLKYLDELKDEVQALIWYKSELEPSDENFIATPGLKIFCQKHKTEIIAFDLNPQRAKENRLACIYCIEQNTIPYTSLIRELKNPNYYLFNKGIKKINRPQYNSQISYIAQVNKNEELTQSLKEFCNFIDGSVNKIIRSMGRNWANQSQKEILDNVDVLSKSIYNDEVILTEDNYYQKEENDINKLVSDSIEKSKKLAYNVVQKFRVQQGSQII